MFVLLLLLSWLLVKMADPSMDPEIVITATEPSSSHGTTATDSSTTVTRKRSLVWAYFQESSTQKEAICTLCEQTVSTCGNTTYKYG